MGRFRSSTYLNTVRCSGRLGLIPDIANAREAASGMAQKTFITVLARGWPGYRSDSGGLFDGVLVMAGISYSA